jgi:transposase InsO family protein
LAVILDGFSRKVVGWSLERTLASGLAVAALQEAIATRNLRPDSSIIPIVACNMPARNRWQFWKSRG